MVLFLSRSFLGIWHPTIRLLVSTHDGRIQITRMLDKDCIWHLISTSELNVVANTALECHIGDQPVHVLRINARRIS